MAPPLTRWTLAGLPMGLLAPLVLPFLSFGIGAGSVHAQIIPDGTLGSQVTSTPDQQNLTIHGGTITGRNLFHSFEQLSVGTGQTATFANSGAIDSILARVTGKAISNIDGRLAVQGHANLFLLNPNGIVFGPNAQLQVSGSFVATTASHIKLADGTEFSAANPSSAPLLTVNVTPGLQYGSSRPQATITNRGQLAVGHDLTLVADRLDLQGSLVAGQDLTLQASDTITIRDTAQTPFLAKSGREMDLQGDRGIDILALSHPNQTPFVSGGNLSLFSNGIISGDARFSSGGSFQIRSVSGGLATFTSLYDPIISTAGDVDLALNYSGASLLIEAGGNIRIQGTVDITAPDVAAPFVGDDGVLNSQPGLILRSGQTALRYSGNSGVVPGSSTGTGLVSTPGITLHADINVAPDGVVRLTAGQAGSISTREILAKRANITLTSAGSITTADVVSGNDVGNGGAITLSAPNGNILSEGLFTYSDDALAFGRGGAINVAAGGTVTIGAIYTGALTNDGGSVSIIAGGEITSESLITFSFVGGDSGTVALISGDSVRFNRIDTSSDGGVGGNVTIRAAADIIGTGDIDTSAFGSGQGGTITVQAGGNIRLLQDATLRSDTFTNGTAGDISVTARSLTLENGAQIRSVSRYGAVGGNAGTITLNIAETTELFGKGDPANGVDNDPRPSAIFTLADLYSTGNGGDIIINTGSLIMREGTEILADHQGMGTNTRAGNITIRAKDKISLEGFRVRPTKNDSPGTGISSMVVATSLSHPNADGGLNRQGGTIDIQAGELELLNGAFISSSLGSQANGQSGNIRLTISQQGTPGKLTIAGSSTRQSGIFSSTASDSVGDGGSIQIRAGSVSLQNNAKIGVETNADGDAGQITLDATSLDIGNRSIISAETTASGNAGRIVLLSDRLAVTDGGQIRNTTSGSGDAGSIQLGSVLSPIAQLSLTGNGSSISASTESGATGDGGNIDVTANVIELASQGRLSATTQSQGNAGNIIVAASDRVFITDRGSGLFANTTRESSGNGGSIFLTTGTLQLQNRGRITVESDGVGSGGDVQLAVDRLFLNQANIVAETASTQGGNIQIQASEGILLRNNSLISATAGTAKAGGDGGNVTISTPFVIGVLSENSDIRANAFLGNGGRVTITAFGILGLQFRLQDTPNSDITASSQFGLDGTVTLNTLNLDPSQGLVELPVNFDDSASQIAQTCSPQQNQSSFVVTGRGGLSSTPIEALNQTELWRDEAAQVASTPASAIATAPSPNPLTEATHWVKQPDGRMALVAGEATPLTWSVASACQPNTERVNR